MSEPSIEPSSVIEMVEAYVYKELSDAEKYENSTPLDEPGVFSLHRLAAAIYAAGYVDGESSESRRVRAAHVRRLDRTES